MLSEHRFLVDYLTLRYIHCVTYLLCGQVRSPVAAHRQGGVLVLRVRLRDDDEAQLRASSGTARGWRTAPLHHLQLLVHGRGGDTTPHGRVPPTVTASWGTCRRSWKQLFLLLQQSKYLPVNIKANTRGSNYKLLNHSFHYDLRKHYFFARIVNIWNSLPNTVVDAGTVNAFKARLDKFWSHQVVKFDFTANLTGTGNRSGVVIS